MTPYLRVTLASLVLAAAGVVAACGGSPAEEPEADAAPDVSVTVAPIVKTTLHSYVTGWGRVEPEPASEGRPAASARVSSPVAGLITGAFASEGQRVAQGAILFQLDRRVADVAAERARQAVRIAEQLVQRQTDLGPGQATSQKAYQEAVAQLTIAQGELRAAELQLGLLEVHAPIAGTVVSLNARLGDSIDTTTVLAELVDLDRLVVSASIRSADAPALAQGQRMELSPGTGPNAPAAAAPPATYRSTVDYISPQVDAATDTLIVRGRVQGEHMRPGQFVNVRIVTDERKDRFAVPIEAILQGEAGSEVALVSGDTATRTHVTTGIREGNLAEVEGNGIREGVSVVVQGAYGLPATSKIKVIGR